ncbi:FAD-binding and (Fe-S)-binding domain-containing protein [Actinomadura parmotrematis]|uniref:FAD-binding oxidoreductase n=1 Tax=Actinomadura parmotrematis TaxID=2864039 RepID=A0ABS7G109_9ACTN|nr:FAD-binding and (Fe-S)-binding domain-containing protein [Actinomadura parmotrematis]MBW8485895.1 FAD-binding oxidoreductase [Actinomadura parmotrematis]
MDDGTAPRRDAATRAAYSGDASVFRRVPAAVAEPRTVDDLARLLAAGGPVTMRGGGTSIAGNAIGRGLVVDTSRHLTAITALDPDARTATVRPGTVLDDLRAAAAPYGLTFGPDPSTHARCTLGGMIGNNACGSHSVAWGTTADNVVALRLLLPDGRALHATRGGSGDDRIDDALRRLRDSHLAPLRTELGRFPRQVSGYGLHHLLPERGFDVAKALVGSEGTCAVFTEATVRLVPVPAARALAVLGFPDVFAAAEVAPRAAAAGALTVEGMAADLLTALRAQPGRGGAGADLPPGGAWLYCEVGGVTPSEAREAAHALAVTLGAPAHVVVDDPVRTRALWWIREAGAGIVTRLPDGGEAWPGWEDSAVPPERLGSYLRELYDLMRAHGLRGVPYGHFGEGCLHLRLDFALDDPRGVGRYRAFMEDAAGLVVAHGGSVSGEHGDGRTRGELLSRMYSPELMRAFAAFKRIFDPEGRLNPGVLVDPEPFDLDLRPGPGRDALPVTPVHALSRDGGSLAAAVDRCAGVGACRTLHTGAMCPSFKATRDEVHSTRGRARVLAELLRGASLPDGWRSTAARDALDLCLSCKACASECPVNVDMATYKAEFLHRHYARRPRPLAHYSMGWLPLWSRLATASPRAARAANAALRVPAIAAAAKRAAGVEPRRDMIRFAAPTLRAWLRERGPSARGGSPVVLWPDTFTDLHEPGAGRAAVEVLEALGHRVLVPPRAVCCGLTWHSTGQLKVARSVLRRSLDVLRPALEAGLPVVGLEPSCTVMLREEAPELLPGEPLAALLAARTVTLAELVDRHEGPWPFGRLDAAAVAQVHCHQEAKGSYTADLSVLARLGVDPDVVAAGCCGLAGNFGFEPGHWDVSQACADRELYPKVNAAGPDDLVLADGFSCRTQIAQGTERRALHLAELLRAALP